MVPGYYLLKWPYTGLWKWAQLLNSPRPVVVYATTPLDIVVLKPVLRHLPLIPILPRNRKTKSYANRLGFPCISHPAFPRVVLMARHSAHLFSCPEIIRIGFRHGPYCFKAFAKSEYYNLFHLFFMTSEKEVEKARACGILTGKAIGFPKLDPAFDGTWNEETLLPYRNSLGLTGDKPTVIFTSTWDRSGMSAIDQWISFLPQIAKTYHVLITVHPWMSSRYVKVLRKMPGIHFIEDPDILPYLLVSDCLVGDMSSIIAEFCALDKPMVTFRVPRGSRVLPEIEAMLEEISVRIDRSSELFKAIEVCLENPNAQREFRQKAIATIFGSLDGKAGLRAAEIIRKWVPGLE